MDWHHPDHAGRRVRLAYCLNLHAADDLAGTLAGMRAVTLPLRARLAAADERFGVGLYLPAVVARELARDERAREELAALIVEGRLDPFTYNAFPFGGFHTDGLKAGVFRPSWLERERVEFTLDVARVAVALARASASVDTRVEPTGSIAGEHRSIASKREPRPAEARAPDTREAHVSISTHSGAFGAAIRDEADRIACAQNFARAVAGLVRLERESGVRVVLALEAEPRASSGDNVSLAGFLGRVRQWGIATLARELGIGEDAALDLLVRHLGTCLDACHSAVEFEEPERALALASEYGPLGKLQFSSALRLADPGGDERGREALLALDEPRYLHQVTGVGAAGRSEVDDLSELRAIVGMRRPDGPADEIAATPSRAARPGPGPVTGRPTEDFASGRAAPDLVTGRSTSDLTTGRSAPDLAARAQWLACTEWRCHFHVPVDLDRVAGSRLTTTRAHADRILALALARPDRWGTDELHLEIETYTWDILPGAARGAGSLVDGLEREYAHVIEELERAGWKRAGARAPRG